MLKMMTREWWNRNAGGVIVTSAVAVLVYALGAYISSSITKEMKNYVPINIWTQWAQERGEWRGQVDQRLKGLEEEQKKQREEILIQLRDLAKDVAVQTTLLGEVRREFQSHIIDTKPTPKNP